MLGFLPDAAQQATIAMILMGISYYLGEKKKITAKMLSRTAVRYMWFVRLNTLLMGIIYTVTIFLIAMVMDLDTDLDKGGDDFLDGNVTMGAHPEESTGAWLQQHSTLFWFFLAMHQGLFIGMFAYETFSMHRARHWVWPGLIPPLLQWMVGLFAQDTVAPAICGLIFEIVTPMLILAFLFKVCAAPSKVRSGYALIALLMYVVTFLPVFFLGTQMKNAHNSLFFTVTFAVMSFFFWGHSVARDDRIGDPIDSDYVLVESIRDKVINIGSGDKQAQPQPSSSDNSTTAFTIEDKE